jgi:hypothetical protein
MGQSYSKKGTQQLNTTNQLGSNAQNTANSIYGTVEPFAAEEVTNPAAAAAPAITAAGQSTAGAVAGANEAANLEAARTRNPAGLSSNIDQAARLGAQQQSQNTLDAITRAQQAGVGTLAGLYGANLGEAQSMYGLGPSTLNAAKQPSWWQSLLGAANQGGQTAAQMANAGMFG